MMYASCRDATESFTPEASQFKLIGDARCMLPSRLDMNCSFHNAQETASGNLTLCECARVCITGEASMHDLTCLLSGAAHCSLGAVSAALPCPGLPEERQLAEARDHRTRHRPDSPSSRSQSES